MFGHAARTEQAYVNQSVLFPKAYIVKWRLQHKFSASSFTANSDVASSVNMVSHDV
jgi:hypothetical protein